MKISSSDFYEVYQVFCVIKSLLHVLQKFSKQRYKTCFIYLCFLAWVGFQGKVLNSTLSSCCRWRQAAFGFYCSIFSFLHFSFLISHSTNTKDIYLVFILAAMNYKSVVFFNLCFQYIYKTVVDTENCIGVTENGRKCLKYCSKVTNRALGVERNK